MRDRQRGLVVVGRGRVWVGVAVGCTAEDEYIR